MNFQFDQLITLALFVALTFWAVRYKDGVVSLRSWIPLVLMFLLLTVNPFRNQIAGGSSFERYKSEPEVPARISVDKPDFGEIRQQTLEDLRDQSQEIENEIRN